MMEWHLMLSYLFTNGLRLILGLYLVAKLMDFSLGKRALLLSILGSCLITVFQIAAAPTIGILIAEIIVVSAITWYYHREQLRLCLFLIFFYEVGIALWDFLLSAGLGILFCSESFIDPSAPESLIGSWLVRLIMLGIVISLEKQRQKTARAMRLASVIVILGLFGAVTLSQQTILPIDEDQVGTWIILSLILMFAILFYRVNRQREMELEIAKLKQDQVEILERDFQALRRTYTDNARLYHDLHNHIEAIYQCLTGGDVQAAVQYCEELRTPFREISQVVWTGDKAIDYLINSKVALAEQEHIQTEVNIEYPHNTNIRSVDLTTILGNLLDNALEAAEKAPEHLHFLHLTVRRINDMLIIKVENGYGEAPTQDNGNLLTAKMDKTFHGWGLKSVQAAAEHYDGVINTEYADGVFITIVTLFFQPIKT